MSHNTFGHLFRITTWGESHGPAIGCVVDGCPPLIPLSEADIQPWLDRRRPGQSKYTNFGRALIGIYDLVGVSWLRKRTALPPVAEHVHGGAAKAAERHIQLVSQRG